MKKFIATYWRINPQLANGGYETTKIIEAKNADSAWKKGSRLTECVYGRMELLSIIPV